MDATAVAWDRLACKYWPVLRVDYVGKLVRGGGVEVVFSVPRRGLQFRAESLEQVEHWMGPRPVVAEALEQVEHWMGPRPVVAEAKAKPVQRSLF